jgi:hypothetical protein
MRNFETPIQFDIKKNINGKEITYTELMEICQGGPEIGDLNIDGVKIENYRFGGPLLFDNDNLFIPVYIKKIFSTGFKIAKINLKTLEIEIFGKMKDIIFLDKIENKKIAFFEDIEKNTKHEMSINL